MKYNICLKRFSNTIIGSILISSSAMSGIDLPAYNMREIWKAPTQKFDVAKRADHDFANHVEKWSNEITGMDDIIVQESLDRIFVFGMNHKVSVLDLSTKRIIDEFSLDVMPAGAVENPLNPNEIYFCGTRGKNPGYPDNSPIGLYKLDYSKKSIEFLLENVPTLLEKKSIGHIYAGAERPSLDSKEFNSTNSRKIEQCNDLAFSNDGKRIYFTEPFDTVGSSNGGRNSQEEVFFLRNNGMIWSLNLENQVVSLVAQNLHFPDGILVKPNHNSKKIDELIITELSMYRMIEINFPSEEEVQTRVIIDELPGSPDGLNYDQDGNIWVAFVKERTKILNYAHRFPHLKPYLFNLPEKVRPVPKGTGFMKINPTTGEILDFVRHDGKLLSEVAVVTPVKTGLWLSTYDEHNPGIFFYSFNPLVKKELKKGKKKNP